MPLALLLIRLQDPGQAWHKQTARVYSPLVPSSACGQRPQEPRARDTVACLCLRHHSPAWANASPRLCTRSPPAGAIITEAFAASFPTMIAYIIDTPRCVGPQTFMTNMLQVWGASAWGFGGGRGQARVLSGATVRLLFQRATCFPFLTVRTGTRCLAV